ncbi:MAG: hypothetical protein HYR76_05860 [Ignavibacteria bacterium]|nr:hypothetical protein [Ignavibacteria bacterium]
MNLKKSVGALETRRLVYSKFLLSQAKKYLENNVVESYFNISVILFANAVEVLVKTLAYCVQGKDRFNDNISEILKSMKSLPDFPFSEFDKIVKARNAIYHGATLHTFSTCKDIEEITERSFKLCLKSYLNLEYDELSLTDLIKDDKIRLPLREAEKYLSDRNFLEAVISSCHGFAMLEHRINQRGRHQVGDFHPDFLWNTEISWIKEQRKFVNIGSSPELVALSNHVEEQVNKKIIGLARRVDFLLMLGSAYENYKHFESIHPKYLIFLDGTFECIREDAVKRNYQKDQADFIFNFVLSTVLDIEPRLKPLQLRSLSGDVYRTIE